MDVKVVDRDKRGTGPNQSADTHVQVYTSHWRKMHQMEKASDLVYVVDVG